MSTQANTGKYRVTVLARDRSSSCEFDQMSDALQFFNTRWDGLVALEVLENGEYQMIEHKEIL